MAVNATLRLQHQGAAGTLTERTDALVICNDDSLLVELGPLLGEHYRVHAVDTPAGIGGQVDIARWVGIVDVDSQAGARGAVSRLQVQHPSCPLIVITARPEDWVDSIGRGAVLAAIGRDQLATARLSEALLAAKDRLRADGIEELDATGPSARPDRFDVSPQRRGSVWAAAAILLVVLGVNGVWLHHRLASAVRSGANSANSVTGSVEVSTAGDRAGRWADAVSAKTAVAASPALPLAESGPVPPGAAASLEAAGPLAPRQQNVMELLSAARVAFRDQKLLPPRPDGELRGDSALELYAQVLSQDPQNDEALDSVRRLLVIGRNRITTDAAHGELDDANRLLGVFKAAGVDAGDLRQLASAISAARPKWLAQRAAQNIEAGDFKTAEQLLAEAIASGVDAATVKALRTQETAKKLELQLRAMATQVNGAVRAGALLQPAMDNARTRVAAMRSIGRNHPLTLQAEQEVQAALVQAGEQATRTAQFDLAQRDLNAAAELGSFAPLSEAKRQLQDAKDAAERAAAVAVMAVQHAQEAAAHAPAAAASVPAAAPRPPPYINARPTRVLPVGYPSGANAHGSVIVEFTLSANGLASDMTVVQSDLPGEFDRAAISAVKSGRYSTGELVNGQPARARIKLRFTE